jgi:hypothetical protein
MREDTSRGGRVRASVRVLRARVVRRLAVVVVVMMMMMMRERRVVRSTAGERRLLRPRGGSMRVAQIRVVVRRRARDDPGARGRVQRRGRHRERLGRDRADVARLGSSVARAEPVPGAARERSDVSEF